MTLNVVCEQASLFPEPTCGSCAETLMWGDGTGVCMQWNKNILKGDPVCVSYHEDPKAKTEQEPKPNERN